MRLDYFIFQSVHDTLKLTMTKNGVIGLKRAIVAGATGLIGSHVVKELLNSNMYSEIHILTRRPTLFANNPAIYEHVIDFAELEDAEFLLRAEDDIFVTLGTTMKKAKSKETFMEVDYSYPLKLAELSKKQSAARFLIVSSMGADSDSRFFYSKVKGELEDSLIKLKLPSLHIFRPSLLLGERDEIRAGEKTAGLISQPLSFLPVGPFEKYKPLPGSHVAAVMYAVSQRESRGLHIYESDQIRHLGEVLKS